MALVVSVGENNREKGWYIRRAEAAGVGIRVRVAKEAATIRTQYGWSGATIRLVLLAPSQFRIKIINQKGM
jgi:predicted transcriptional regulator